jgi:prepilin-type N-terminal cleavage/methylation domain-containing protein
VRQGFTLLELSIVLVIIGLLIGGIFVGQSLIHTAQLNAVISEFNRYQTATQNFKQQYQALPGDMNNATSFWGSAGGTGSDATCQNTVSTTAATCNGNGDGVIGTSVVAQDEISRYWQHLANAKMIEGSYTGVGYGGAASVPGTNMPASRYGGNTGWLVLPSSVYCGGGAVSFSTDCGKGHLLMILNPTVWQGGITPKDAWTIDKKIDDGKPGMGNVIAYNWPACTNAASMSDMTATYTLTTKTAICALFFVSSF